MSRPFTTLSSSLRAVRNMTGSLRALAALHTEKPLPSASPRSTSSRSGLSEASIASACLSPEALTALNPSALKNSSREAVIALSSSVSRW